MPICQQGTMAKNFVENIWLVQIIKLLRLRIKVATGNCLLAKRRKNSSKFINAGTGTTCQPVVCAKTSLTSANWATLSVGKSSHVKPCSYSSQARPSSNWRCLCTKSPNFVFFFVLMDYAIRIGKVGLVLGMLSHNSLLPCLCYSYRAV